MNPSLRGIRLPFAQALAYNDAATDKRDNSQAQQVEVFHFGGV
jgi:hypothetical protein